MVTSVSKMPVQGETILGGDFKTNPGGKGANQAVAASRLGADVVFVGAVGQDALGQSLVENLKAENIGTENISMLRDVSTGIATIIVSDDDNRIIVASGANNYITPEQIDASKDAIISSDILLMQFEIPMETISYTVELAHQYNIPVIVNPAPYQPIPKTVLEKVSLFTPNEGEAAGMREDPIYSSITDKLVITKGKHGATFYEEGKAYSIPAYKVNVIDTTGAGDTFNGALGVKLASGSSMKEAVIFANAASALSIGILGAQNGMPNRNAVEDFIKNN